MHVRRLAIAAALLLPAVARAQMPTPMPAQAPAPSVTTTGRGEGTVAPDRATVTVAVETRGATAALAGAANATLQKKVLDALRALGLPNERLGTSGYSVMPEYAYQEGRSPRVTGYVARNAVRADVRDVSTVGRVIDAALAAGANNINGVEFGATKLDDARRTALSDAVRGACRDADALARAAGAVLGKPIDLQSSFDMPSPPRPMMAMAKSADAAQETSINAGDLTVNVMVTARWSLLVGGQNAQSADAQRCQ